MLYWMIFFSYSLFHTSLLCVKVELRIHPIFSCIPLSPWHFLMLKEMINNRFFNDEYIKTNLYKFQLYFHILLMLKCLWHKIVIIMLVKITNALGLWVRQRTFPYWLFVFTFQFFIYYPNPDNPGQNRSLINYKSQIVIRKSKIFIL